ncbi:hypothetical protein KY311_00065 [Candidatus Woesearchaeota archaeon]|nr:hypothetical protein [Candidatus Woesearchaeota archaeon]
MGGECWSFIADSVKHDDSLVIGKFSSIEGIVEIGKNVKIGNNVTISSTKSRIKIEDGVEISKGCTIMPDDFNDKGGLEIVIGEGAKLKRNVSVEGDVVIGPKCYLGIGTVIGKHCKLGEECQFRQYVTVAKYTVMGNRNIVYPFADIGSAPQGQYYEDKGTSVVIGDDNLIRELSVINRGSEKGGGVTRIGDKNKIYSQTHIAHDCTLGNNIEFVSISALAGHVTVCDHVRISGLAGIAQWLRIGEYAFIGGGSVITKNVPPYASVFGNPAQLKTVNKERMKRLQDDYRPLLKAVREAYNGVLWNPDVADGDLVARLKELGTEPAMLIAGFIESLSDKQRQNIYRGIKHGNQSS